MACPSVTLNGLVIDGDTIDGDGMIWNLDSLQGWWDAAPVRLASQEIEPVGEYVTVARENARALVLEATATSPNTGEGLSLAPLGNLCFTAMESAKTAGRCVYVPVVMTVVDPVHTLHANVRRAGGSSAIKSTIVGDLQQVSFQWQLFMPDPRRYDADLNPFD